jgi:hypothetical protein
VTRFIEFKQPGAVTGTDRMNAVTTNECGHYEQMPSLRANAVTTGKCGCYELARTWNGGEEADHADEQ